MKTSFESENIMQQKNPNIDVAACFDRLTAMLTVVKHFTGTPKGANLTCDFQTENCGFEEKSNNVFYGWQIVDADKVTDGNTYVASVDGE